MFLLGGKLEWLDFVSRTGRGGNSSKWHFLSSCDPFLPKKPNLNTSKNTVLVKKNILGGYKLYCLKIFDQTSLLLPNWLPPQSIIFWIALLSYLLTGWNLTFAHLPVWLFRFLRSKKCVVWTTLWHNPITMIAPDSYKRSTMTGPKVCLLFPTASLWMTPWDMSLEASWDVSVNVSWLALQDASWVVPPLSSFPAAASGPSDNTSQGLILYCYRNYYQESKIQLRYCWCFW